MIEFVIVAAISILCWEVFERICKGLRFKILEREDRAIRGTLEGGRWRYEGPDAEEFRKKMEAK